MNKVIGYVGTRDLGGMRNADIRCLDVINIAFGQVEDRKYGNRHPAYKLHNGSDSRKCHQTGILRHRLVQTLLSILV